MNRFHANNRNNDKQPPGHMAHRRLKSASMRANKRLATIMLNPKVSPFSRRKFIARSATAALLAGVPLRWAGSVYASDAPEISKMKFGMIALTDCSPIVIAHEKGIFKKYGIESTVAK